MAVDHNRGSGGFTSGTGGSVWDMPSTSELNQDFTTKAGAPQIRQNPYASNWNDLIKQLEAQSRGEGPSLAGNAYKQASNEGLRQQMGMARGGSAGQARQAGMNMATINQGQAQGYSNARLQEQLAARQSLQGALTNAGNAWFQPQQANLEAQLKTPDGLQRLTALFSGIFGAAAAGS